MMSFGWRPNQSCYVNAQKETAKQIVSCPSPTWFYVLVGVAIIAGTAGKK
jgi:hypothetical protein